MIPRLLFCTGRAARFSVVLGSRTVTPTFAVQVRQFSIVDTFSKMATNKVEEQREKNFASMMESMVSGEKWSLRPMKKSLEDQLSSWLLNIPGLSSQADKKELTALKEMLDAMTEKELDDPLSLDVAAKERIGRATGKTVEDVSKLIHYYKQTLIMQQWLVMKKANGERLPVTQKEMMALQENDVRIRTISTKVMQDGRKRKGRGKGSPF